MSAQTVSSNRGAAPYQGAAPLLAQLTELESEAERHAVRVALTVAFLPVVAHIAARYAGRGEPTEDLRQAGTIGLIGALDRFAPRPDGADLVSAFLAFAVPTVTGEIRKHFRDRTWSMHVPRRMKDLQAPIREAAAELAANLRRAPRPSEIAARLDMGREEVVQALNAAGVYRSIPLDAPLSPTGATIADVHGDLDAGLENVVYRRELRLALDELPDRERWILILRFFGDKTQTEIAAEMGISQMHVSRLLTRSLAALRSRMSAEGPADHAAVSPGRCPAGAVDG